MISNALHFTFFFVVLLDTSMVDNNWKVLESGFEGQQPRLMWYARIGEGRVSETRDWFDVVVCYDSASLEPLYELEVAEQIGSYEFILKGKVTAHLSVWRNEIFSVEAIANPPKRVLYLFLLEAANRYRVVHRTEIAMKTVGPESIAGVAEEDHLEENARDLLRAIRKKKLTKVQGSTMVRIAAWLVSTKEKLGESEERLLLKSCRVRVGKRTQDIPVTSSKSGETVLRLAARVEDSLTLLPTFRIRLLTPYSNRVNIDDRPLPSYAFVKLDRDDGTIRLFGISKSNPGEFQLGPVKVQNLQKIRLEASHPLYPRGSHSSTVAQVLFRTGRAIEAYLEEGRTPPPPALPEDLKPAGLIEAVLREAQKAIDPDRAVVMGLNGEARLALYAAGFDLMPKYTELQEILREALMEAAAQRGWTFHQEPELSRDTSWTERDALIVLRHPSLARQFADRLSREYEPVLELFKTKEVVEPERQVDRQSISPHALAAAALGKAHAREFDALISSQLSHLAEIHSAKNPSSWRFSDLENVGQSMKVVTVQVEDSNMKRLAAEILKKIRDEAFQRFREEYAQMTLSEKVAVAHLMSSSWYPYFNLPSLIASVLEKAEGEFPTQRMEPGRAGRDVTGETLENVRRLYKSAFERGLKELRTSKQSKQEKRVWMEKFLDEWHDYLFRAHKGGYLQAYEDELRRDRERALKSLR